MAQADRIVFGTMRMADNGADAAWWADFLTAAHERGVATLHSSSEYASFSLLCATLALLRCDAPGVRFRHIVKLAEPSFDDAGFDSARLASKIDAYRSALGVDVIDDVQWMWRRALDDDAARIDAFAAAASALASAAGGLKARGAIGRLLCFGYTPAFAARCLDIGGFDGLVFYRNDAERDFDPLLDSLSAQSLGALVIRPFLAGDLIAGDRDTPRAQIDRALDHPAIEGAILSTSSLAHLDELIG